MLVFPLSWFFLYRKVYEDSKNFSAETSPFLILMLTCWEIFQKTHLVLISLGVQTQFSTKLQDWIPNSFMKVSLLLEEIWEKATWETHHLIQGFKSLIHWKRSKLLLAFTDLHIQKHNSPEKDLFFPQILNQRHFALIVQEISTR